MITRKAIQAAFELITEDRGMAEVAVFVFKDGTPLEEVCYVNVTRDMEFPDRYTVKLGLMTTGFQKWFWEQTRLKEVSPKLYTRYWLYGKEKLALKRRKAKQK